MTHSTRRLDPLFPVDSPFSAKLNFNKKKKKKHRRTGYLRGKNKVSEIQLCGKGGGSTGKSGVQTSSACVMTYTYSQTVGKPLGANNPSGLDRI